MPVALSKPPRKRGPPAPLNLQPSDVVSTVILEKEPIQAEPTPQQPAVVQQPRTTSKARASRNVKGLALNLSSANTSQENSPSSPTVPEAQAEAPPPRRPSAASLPGTSVSAVLRRTNEGDTPSTEYLNGPIEIMPLIWLGSEDNARDWQGLIQRGIRSILNVAKEVASLYESTSHNQMRNVVSTPNLAEFPRSPGPYQPAHFPSGRPPMNYLKLAWSHGQSDLVRKGFPEAFAFVDAAVARNEGVLVHCQCGISRSATMVIALVMRAAAEGASNTPADILELRGKGMQGAYDYVKRKSQSIGPNMSLIYQLLDYERALRGGDSVDSSENASEDEEWERQRRLLDSPMMEDSDVWKEAKELDREMEERRARKLSFASTSSNASFTGAIGNGAPWRSRYTAGTFIRARAPSVESNLTSRSSISVLSEDPVEEEEEEEQNGTLSTDATDEDAHRFDSSKPLEPLTALPKRISALRMSAIPPSAPANKRSFNLPPVPPSAPANKKGFRLPSIPPSAPPTKQTFDFPSSSASPKDSERSPQKKEKRRPPPLQGVSHLGVVPTIQVIHTPSAATARTPSIPSISSITSSKSSQASSMSSRRRSFKPISFVPFPCTEPPQTAGLPYGATPSATQTLFVFPPSPRTGSMTPSTLTVTSTPLYTPGFGSIITPRASVFRRRTDSHKSYIQLSAATPTTATARVDAKGFFGPV